MTVNNPTKEQWAKLYDGATTNYEWLSPVLSYAGHKTLEIGCGSGLLSKRLRELGYNSYTNDLNDLDSSTHRIFDVTKEWRKENYDTVFSCGLLEHFEDEDIIKILKRAASHAKTIISMVPYTGCKGYWEWRWQCEENGTWNYGNERTFDTLLNLYTKAGIKVINEYTIGDDFGGGNYLLVTVGTIE